MLRLPSGRVVDIAIDRARHHALRCRGLGQGASHDQLHALVDVVFRNLDESGEPCLGWTEFDYTYSGYILAQIPLLKDWPEADKVALLQWVAEPNQIRRIETARRRLEGVESLSVKHNSSPDYLYSVLLERIETLNLTRATVSQWRATLFNLKKSGVRDEELQWSGVLNFLKKFPDDEVLEKKLILQAVNFKTTHLELTSQRIWGEGGGLCFRETGQCMNNQSTMRYRFNLDASCVFVLRYVDDLCNYRVGVIKTLTYGHYMALNKYWFALDYYDNPITNKYGNQPLFFSSSEDAMAAANVHASDTLGLKNGASFHAPYGYLTLHGGQDYREWLLSLPDFQRTFFGSHYFDHNVLLHVRTTTRTSNDGHRLMFIEELQSDWHQSGQRLGYDSSPWGSVANAPFKNEWVALALKLMLVRASRNGFDGIAWPSGEIQETRYARTLHSIKQRYDREIPKILNKLGKSFSCQVSQTKIATKDPWLTLVRDKDKWHVTDCGGKFKTRAKYNRDQALEVMALHSKTVDLEVPVFWFNEHLKQQISEQGLPLFGESY